MNVFSLIRNRAFARFASASAIALGLAASSAWSAELARDPRPVSGIDRVVLRTVGNLEIRQGAEEALVVEAEPKVIARITTKMSGGTLTIDSSGGGFSTREPVRFVLQVKRLGAIESSASGSIHATALTADRLQLALSGSGEMRIDELTARTLSVEGSGAGTITIGPGHVDRAEIRMSGSGEYAAPELRAIDARVDVDGSAEAVVAVDRSLAASVGGAGRIGYRGNPALTRRVGGAGSIEREE